MSSGWEVFFGRRERRNQKAAGEGEQLATANPPFHTQTGDNGGHWSICFYLSFFVLFFPHRAAGRCFAFSFARSLGPLSSHLFRHLPGQQFLLFMSQTRRGREAERQRERERGGGIFFFFFWSPFFGPLLFSFHPTTPSFHSPSPVPLHRYHFQPSPVQPTFPPPFRLPTPLLLLPTTPLAVHP